MKFLSRLIIIFCVAPFILFSMGYHHQEPLYCKIAAQVRAVSAKKLAKKHHMNLCGIGGGMMDNVNLLGCSFEIYRPLTKNEARALAVSCVQEFLQDINRDEKVRPYLVVYPFVAKHVEITIFVCGARLESAYHPHLAVVSAFDGNIGYSTNDPINPYRYAVTEYESFEDAVKILKGEIPAPETQIK